MSRALYLEDPYLAELETEVVAAVPAAGGTAVELAESILHPGGGGQPADGGWIGGAPVLGSRREGGATLHVVEGEVRAGPVTVRLDWTRRYDHMQQHTAQHLLTATALARLGWRTVGFGIGPETSYIDVDRKGMDPDELARLEEMVAAEVRAARPVRWYWVEPADLERLRVRSRRLPRELDGPVRIVEIEGLDRNTCGGTHVRSTAEVEAVAFVGREPMHGGTRLHWVAGGRLRRWVASRRELLRRLRETLDAADLELAEAAARRLEEAVAARREARRWRSRLAEEIASRLRAGARPVAVATLDDGELVWAVAAVLAGSPGGGVHLLAAPGGAVALALGEGVTVPAERLWPAVAAALEARGGGRGRLCRGTARCPERLDAARAALERALGDASR